MSASMFSRRALQSTTRRLALVNPSALNKTPFSRLSAPAAIATGQYLQTRRATSDALTPKAGNEILANQRLNRPISPHLGIYRPQITWYLSLLNRLTGLTISATVYGFGIAYLVSPLFGWHLESASIAAAFGALPVALKFGLKAFFAMPFTLHSFNGIRHLVWDTGATLTNKAVIVTGWSVIGVSVASALYLVLGM